MMERMYMYKKILVPTDGSEHAIRAEKEAMYIAENTGAELIGMSIVENNFVNGLPLNDEVYELNNLLKENTQKNVNDFEKLVGDETNSVTVRSVIKEGTPAKAILETAEEEDVDLIVIGSSGKSGFDRFLMGSVADKVSKSAKCSVLVVH